MEELRFTSRIEYRVFVTKGTIPRHIIIPFRWTLRVVRNLGHPDRLGPTYKTLYVPGRYNLEQLQKLFPDAPVAQPVANKKK